MIYRHLLKLGLAIGIFFSLSVKGQNNTADSLEITPLIAKVLETYPTVQLATEALNVAEFKIALVRSAFLPNAQFSGSFSHIGPVPSLTLPDVGSFSLAPENNYNATININQTITDFGKTKKNIELEEKNKELSKLGIDQVKQKISMTVISCFYNMFFYQEAVRIKNDQIATLQIHLRTVEKKAETGSATQFEILSTKVRLSTIESQKTDAVTALNYQNSILNTLLGESVNTTHRIKNRLTASVVPFSEDSLIEIALRNRNELKIADNKLKVAMVNQDLIKKHENPVVSAFANGGWKNGYIPQLDKPKANYAIGVSLLIPIYDAKRSEINLKIAGSSILSNSYEKDLTRRNITAEVMEYSNALKAAISKSELFYMQLSQAKKALELADLKFKSGTLTNLDLLDSENAVAESNLMYLKSSIERVVIGFKLKAALGINLY